MPENGTAISVCLWLMTALGILSWFLVLYSLHRAKVVRAQAGDLLFPAVHLALAHPPKKVIVIYCATIFCIAVAQESWGIVLFALICFLTMSPYVLWGRSSLGPSYLEVRQRGLIVGGASLLGWSSIRSCRFQDKETSRLVIQTSDARLDLPLQLDCRLNLEPVLMRYLPQEAR